VASTIAVEAAIFDTPVVNVSFDGETPAEWTRSARRYLRFTHFANVTRHGAVKLAESPAQLVSAVAQYLVDPTADAEGRRRVVREQCEFVDGRSSERVATAVIATLDQLLGSAARRPVAMSKS
jgi:CDP-glycerol glycerophosphotransferase (TagB/SpsB family)